MMRAALLAALLVCSPVAAAAREDCQGPELLTASQWREDVTAAYDQLRSVHPRPTADVSADTLQHARDSLLTDIPCLADQQVFARLSQLVALLRDGHTRLALPRAAPGRGLGIAHTGTATPSIPLAFAPLPLEFSLFDDGVFVTATTPEYRPWLGARLHGYNGVAIDTLLEGLSSVAFAENDSATRLKVADRLAYPELVSALGLTAPQAATTLELEPPGRTRTRVELPLALPDSEWLEGFGEQPPLRLRHLSSRYAATYLPDLDAHYVAINRIDNADSGPGLVQFFAEQIDIAESRDARLVIDLRNNFGGNGEFNRGLLLALLASEEINQYGRCYVLIGSRTFSAAQFLVNDLEAYSRALFVGEPSGARPDSYGDSKKRQLPNSGLTLRVSSLHWSSWLANDPRQSTAPLIAAPWRSELWFAGRDPALEAIAQLPASLTPLQVLERGLLQNDQISVYRVLDGLVNAPQPASPEFAKRLLTLGKDLQARGEWAAARLCYLYGQHYFPGQAGFDAALDAMNAS